MILLLSNPCSRVTLSVAISQAHFTIAICGLGRIVAALFGKLDFHVLAGYSARVSSVLQEHIEYLSIEGRYALYEAAFREVIADGDVVADLGCGVGVLGLQCLKAGAARIYGVDASDAIHLARETMERSNLADRYSCLATSTFDAELKEKVDAIVCDHIGYFGFDYGLLDMIRDASSRLLKRGGTIVPDRLRLHIAGVTSKRLSEMASAWTAECIPSEYKWLNEQHRNCKFGVQVNGDEVCSGSEKVCELLLGGRTPEYFVFRTTLIFTKAGHFDGIVGWFDCHLGGNVWMTNSPLEERAIDRPQAFLPALQPLAVEKNSQIEVLLRFDSSGEMIAWTFTPLENGEKVGKSQKLSTFNSMILAPSDLVEKKALPLCLSRIGKARATVLRLMDGTRSHEEIVENVLEEHPTLFASEAELHAFVERETKHNRASENRI
ncbi:MAG: methyltransferase [Pseudomonadota bacterium]